MKLELDDDYADKITSDCIVDEYIKLRDIIKDAKKNPKKYEPEDLEYWLELLPALELVGGWFIYNFEEKMSEK